MLAKPSFQPASGKPADTQRRFGVQVFLTPWDFLCYFQQSPNTADPISALPEAETCRISDTSWPFSLAGCWQNPPFVGPLG